jgi:hypothetical protein
MDILTHGELTQIRKGIESIARSLEKLAAPALGSDGGAADFNGWKEKGPGPLLVQNSEDAKHRLFDGIMQALTVTGYEERNAVINLLNNFFDGREDTDRKLAAAYGELSSLRKAASNERLAGMKRMFNFIEQAHASEGKITVKNIFDAGLSLIEMNTPQSEEIAV